MIFRKIVTSFALMISSLVLSQGSVGDLLSGPAVVGRAVDKEGQQAIEYANITIYSLVDSSLVTGGISDEQGRFIIPNIKPGRYYATIKFMGYEEIVYSPIEISKAKPVWRIGKVELEASAQNLNEVEILADRQQVVYKIDKKVVNPSQFITSQGGNAIDILANTPSVSVDIEGNVSMRGSSNFMVLINGKPTPFEPSDALAQIPASSIENIEIITNPSAKYDPDGAAGIINIITKAEGSGGWDGIVNLNASTLGAYGGDFLFNLTGEKTRFYLGGGRSDRLRKAEYSNTSGTIDLVSGDTSHVQQLGDRTMNFKMNTLKAGIDYSFNKKHALGLEFQVGQRDRYFESLLDNSEWNTGGAKDKTYAQAITDADGTSFQTTLNQNSQFGENKDHTLISSLMFQGYNGNDNTYSDKDDAAGLRIITQETWEEEESTEIRFKTDYTRPWENGKIEAGYQLRYDDEWSSFDAEFDTLADNDQFYSESNFLRLINGAYFTFSGEYGQLGYQLGLRGEHTLRQLTDQSDSLLTDINRVDWYPSLHLSYNLSQSQSFMASYTRRIDRPRAYWLEPTVTWRDPNNVRQGNPSLLPQYINSYELSYQLRFGERNFLSAELFHRNVNNKIERTRNKYQDGVLMTKFENIGEDFSTGIELMLNYNVTPWWTANLSTSVYDYRIEADPAFSASVNERQSNNWRARLSNTLKVGPTLRFQVDGMYNSPSITATGRRSAMAFSSVAIKKSFFHRKLDLGVSVFDVLNTAKMHSYSSGDTYYSEFEFDMQSPVVQFSLTYLFNNYKPERQREKSEGGAGIDMEY